MLVTIVGSRVFCFLALTYGIHFIMTRPTWLISSFIFFFLFFAPLYQARSGAGPQEFWFVFLRCTLCLLPPPFDSRVPVSRLSYGTGSSSLVGRTGFDLDLRACLPVLFSPIRFCNVADSHGKSRIMSLLRVQGHVLPGC